MRWLDACMGCYHSVFHLSIEGALGFTWIGFGLIPEPKSRHSRCLPMCFFTGCEREIMDHELPSESQLMADLKATFPALWFRPLREFGKDYAHMIGVWTGGSGDMPDGLPIFDGLRYHGDSDDPSDGSYDGGVHDGFTAWLESRGWYTETHDVGTYLVIPIAYALKMSTEKSAKEAV